ncbi:MAG TPA: VWA domain-containing protein [Acidobacteriaceae bacterium]|jgi:VWFA-related protein|nr:VWA domain-containing protein [Acidobacteriaceae bacterium]
MSKAVASIVRPVMSLACVLGLAASLAAQTQAPPATGSAQAQGGVPNPPAASGQGAGASDTVTPTFRISSNEVYLVFAVTDKHGHFIRDLKQSDFALLDDNKAPAQVYSFTQQTNLPLRVGILIDTSTSIRNRFQFEQQAATSFLLQILRPRTDRAFVEGFDVTPDYKQDWTNNLDSLSTGIDELRPGGGTALYDAVYSACRDKLLTARGQEPVRKAIVLVSDGDDNQSHAYLEDAIKECQRAETNIYAISTDVSPSRDRGDDVLEKMAVATGGKAFYPQSLEDMPNSFKQIQDELRSQYALVYKPADFRADGAFRPIYLFCLDRKYTVRVRQGYFAPKG